MNPWQDFGIPKPQVIAAPACQTLEGLTVFVEEFDDVDENGFVTFNSSTSFATIFKNSVQQQLGKEVAEPVGSFESK